MVELIDIFLLRKKMDQVVADKPGLGKALLAWVLVYILYYVLSLFWGTLAQLLGALLMGGDVGLVLVGVVASLLLSIIIVPVVIIVGVLFSFFSDAVVFLFAKLLGGKGDGLIQFFSASLYVSAAITLLLAIILPLLYIPFLNI